MKTHSAAKVICTHPAYPNNVLLAKRLFKGSDWQYEPIGGCIETDFQQKTSETFEACAEREVQEELGIKVAVGAYLGSYYVFWSTDPMQCSHCAVFWGQLSTLPAQLKGQDTCSYLTFEWVSRENLCHLRHVSSLATGLCEIFQRASSLWF